MARGIIIFGGAGSGKTTVGRMVAERLDDPYYDLDDFIWRRDTEKPFTVMYSREEKAGRLMEAISAHAHFVMAGSMDSFNAPFVPLFDLAVHVSASVETRLARIHQRELAAFGERILEGGDLYEGHQRFLEMSARYDTDGSPCLKTHLEWAATLPCKVLYVNGEGALDAIVDEIVTAYRAVQDSRLA